MSLTDWMSDADFDWRMRLKPVNLVVETDFSMEEVQEAQAKYGAAAKHLLGKGWTHKELIQRYPALTLVVLVGHAALAYDQGAYWDGFWEALGMRRHTDFENEIRRSVVDLLSKFSLARFPDIERDSARKYVMMFALHAGIPVHCLGDLLIVIQEHIRQGRPATGVALMEWLEEPGKEYRAGALDLPVRNFLVNGAEFAADILDRIIEFIEATTAEPDLLQADLDSSTTGLPGVLLNELVIRLREIPIRLDRDRQLANIVRQPAIRYDVDVDEVALILPEPAVAAQTPWRVSFDGSVDEVLSARKWGGDANSAAARVAVPGPVREIIVTHAASSFSSALPLIVKSDPLLTFDQGGRWIARRDALKDAAWVVFPDDHQLVDGVSATPITLRDSGCPAGWHGWRSAFVELDRVNALRLHSAGAAVGTVRRVRKDARPNIRLGLALSGVFSADGRAIHDTTPEVILPSSSAGAETNWAVRVRRLGQTDWLADENIASAESAVSVNPFRNISGPKLGLYEIHVSGPLGADARAVAFIAEGLNAAFDSAIRVPAQGGLTPCRVDVSAKQLTVSPGSSIVLGTKDLETNIQLIPADAEFASTIVIKPPYVEFRSGEVGAPAAWRMTPDICDPDDFATDRFVAIRAPGVDTVTFSYVSELGDVLQRGPQPRRGHGGVFEAQTRQFADTVRTHPRGQIVATLSAAGEPLSIIVSSVQPGRLASDVYLHDDVLEFEDAAPLEGLAAHVWSATTPWLKADVLSVVDGKSKLPEHLVEGGDLFCQLFIDDPWVVVDPPTRPRETAFRVPQDGWREDLPPSEIKLSRYLAGVGKPPANVGPIPEIWASLAQLHADGKTQRFADLITLLTDDPRTALDCLGDSSIPAGDKMAMLIRSELVNQNYSAAETWNELHAHPWFGCMVELADLGSLHIRHTEAPMERAATIAYLRDRGGEPLMALLQSGATTHIHESCLDANAFIVSRRPRTEIEAKLREVQLVPRAQLHPENLRAAVYEALCRRTDWMASGWSPGFAKQTSFVISPIQRASKRAAETLTIRSNALKGIDISEDPWTLMALESLTLAFLARLEAHGRIRGQYLNSGLLAEWARLAQLCPTMVANDILIAEATLLYDRRGDLIEVPR